MLDPSESLTKNTHGCTRSSTGLGADPQCPQEWSKGADAPSRQKNKPYQIQEPQGSHETQPTKSSAWAYNQENKSAPSQTEQAHIKSAHAEQEFSLGCSQDLPIRFDRTINKQTTESLPQAENSKENMIFE